jgi:hypothetical protein
VKDRYFEWSRPIRNLPEITVDLPPKIWGDKAGGRGEKKGKKEEEGGD